ncbi:sensor histidine kinase [Streptomyces sp. PLAI1-29]|uniref:histidine kinase n=2 Tax=Streptomyces zingiberis TaxID=2053010 RepID=A0ABX1C418_9ACTN|nr:sensor histidine kinase [Streptomyces zingiberis]
MAAAAMVLTFGLGMVFTWPPAVERLRRVADAERRRLGERTGVPVERPYAPLPPAGEAEDGDRPADEVGSGQRPPAHRRGCVTSGRLHGPRYRAMERKLQRYITDPATWRDFVWAAVSPVLAVVAAVPLAAVCYAVFGLLLPALTGQPPHSWTGSWPTSPLEAVPTGLAVIGLGLATAPAALRVRDEVSAFLLRPTARDRLSLRVRQLAETRSDAVDAQAAELRRIERDLHDGVQARLIAVGLNLGAIEQLVEDDPAAARAVAAQARESSERALAELRGLVRGIHPPVLAERGLVDAVRAVAVDSPLETEVSSELTGEPPAALRSAVYFAVSELLTNAARHSDARRAWIDLHSVERGTPREALRVTVTDDGQGGAHLTEGGGLRGVERRLATFDGVLALSSPAGGPTLLTLEIPCALSSPRTSSC